jgi:protein involved in polysaccharide export with SLBB domain
MKKLLSALVLFIFIANSEAQINTNLNLSNNNDLLKMGTINVTIGGKFVVTGTFPALITERVDAFITRMYDQIKQEELKSVTDPLIIKQIDEKLNNYVLRNITLKRATGEVLKLDLQKFRLDGDFANNPYLKNDDVLIFPQPDLEHNSFIVSGAVNSPGRFYYMEGDHLQDALELAQGINKAYENVEEVEIHRLNYEGDQLRIIQTDINSNPPIERGDGIIVVAKETQKKGFSVIVTGEVNNPGRIPITKDATTITKVIKQAGGFKEDASLRRSKLFTGKSLPLLMQSYYGIKTNNAPDIYNKDLNDFLLRYQNYLMYRMSNVDELDSAYFFMENELRILLEKGPVDFTKINDTTSNVSDYIVSDGDIIIIPPKEKTVYVFGQVAKPGKVSFVAGKDYEYYIDEAGGTGEYARSDIMLIKAATREWIPIDNDNAKIEEGDYIYVPRTISKSLNYYVKIGSIYLGVISSLATIALLIVNLTK